MRKYIAFVVGLTSEQHVNLLCRTVVCALALAMNARASITISPSRFLAGANDQVWGTADLQRLTATAIPTSATLNAIDGEAYSKNAINWDVISGKTILDLSMNHGRPGTLLASAESDVDRLRFTANSNEPYSLSGFYDVNDVDVGQGGAVSMFVELYNESANVYLFQNWQYSASTHNEQFVLGGTGGDKENLLFGNSTGNLIAGQTYLLHSVTYIQAYPDADSGATGLGNVTLTIGATVPEPSSGLVCLTAILVTQFGRNRIRPLFLERGKANGSLPGGSRSRDWLLPVPAEREIRIPADSASS